MNKKIILALSIMLAPFFSQADNIFENGAVQLEPTDQMDTCLVSSASTNLNSFVGQACDDAQAYCEAINHGPRFDGIDPEYHYRDLSGRFENITSSSKEVYCSWDTWTKGYWNDNTWTHDGGSTDGQSGTIGIETIQIRVCPPPDQTKASYLYEVHQNNDGQPEFCADPVQISQVDSCSLGNGNDFLTIGVTDSVGCFSQSDGSICKYQATSHNGQDYYAMDLEGDCYSENLPDLNGTAQDTPASSDDTCKDWGGTGMICPESPNDVCDSGSVYAGGTINSCQEGCGEINGVFTCIDNDMDGDNVPDYLDPDIDGDGIRNEVDLDSDGDGQDDPIDNSNGGSGDGQGNVTVNVDTDGVVAKLEEIRKQQNETNVETDIIPTEGLTSFWESEYEDGFSGMFEEKITEVKETALFTFLDKFKPPTFSGAYAMPTICFNLAAMGNYGCHALDIDSRVFPSIKVFILILAGFACRRIIFGG